MERKESIKEAREIYKEEMNVISKNPIRWKQYLDFSSNIYKKYTFIQSLLIFAQDSSIQMCGNAEEWKKVNRIVKSNAVPIKIIEDTKNEVCLRYVYNVNDTYGDNKVFSRKWEANGQTVFNILKENYGYENVNTVADIVSEYTLQQVDNNLYGVLLEEDENEVYNPDFLECLVKSTVYKVLKRCNIEIEDAERTFETYNNIR